MPLMQKTRVLVGGCVSAWVSEKAFHGPRISSPARQAGPSARVHGSRIVRFKQGRKGDVVEEGDVVGSRRHSEMRPRSRVRNFLWVCEKLNLGSLFEEGGSPWVEGCKVQVH